MTEAEWLAATDPQPMLDFLRWRAGDRKLRLFDVACCRMVWHLLPEEGSERGVEAAEGFADGLVDRGAFAQANEGALQSLLVATNNTELYDSPAQLMASRAAFEAAGGHGDVPHVAGLPVWRETAEAFALDRRYPNQVYRDGVRDPDGPEAVETERLGLAEALGHQAAVLRDLFGNPFRPAPAVDPAWLAWRGGVVRELARAAYEERRLPDGMFVPARLAALADALEDAGCTDADLLGHLRGPGSHVRGCWAVDLVVGKS